MGCYQDGVPAFGLVLDVERGALYSARHGGGALRDETPIHVSHCGVLRDALLTTPGVLHTFLRGAPPARWACRACRSCPRGAQHGGVALELCAVAAGEAELFVALRSCPWDHNAARIILAEAGGCICALDGAPLPQDTGSAVLAACSRPLLEQVLAGISANTSSRGERLTHRLPGRGRATAPTYSGPCTPPKQPPGLL